MIANGTGFKSLRESVELACRTAVNGEKYRSVDVKMPIRGMRVVTIELADDISKELPPRNDMGVGSDNFTGFA